MTVVVVRVEEELERRPLLERDGRFSNAASRSARGKCDIDGAPADSAVRDDVDESGEDGVVIDGQRLTSQTPGCAYQAAGSWSKVVEA
jgi:hypothetical protein